MLFLSLLKMAFLEMDCLGTASVIGFQPGMIWGPGRFLTTSGDMLSGPNMAGYVSNIW